jgi:hypothetical protein
MKKNIMLLCGVVLIAPIQAMASTATLNGQNYNLVGSANIAANGDLQLTNNVYQAGSAWELNAVSTTQDFIRSFTFSLANPLASLTAPMADGISFAIQNIGNNAQGTSGYGLGFDDLNATGSVIKTFFDSKLGLVTNGIANSAPAFTAANLGANTTVTGIQSLSYNALSNILSLSSSINTATGTYAFAQTASVNLQAKYGSSVYLGFTGGTGDSSSDQRISAVPLPAGVWLMLSGLIGVLGLNRRKSAIKA